MLESEWDVRGLRRRAASYNTAANSVLNEVLWDYNDFGQATREYQEHGGAVNPSASLHVDYTYADPGNPATPNTTRLTSIGYPSSVSDPTSTVISTAYDGEMANALSRPDAIKQAGSALSTYRYLGLGTAVGITYPAASDVAWSLDTTVSGVKDYTGLDRFGRLVETKWKKGSDYLVHSHYGRNRFGGVVWRYDDAAHALGTPVGAQQDNYYWYDGLYQVNQHQRGTLNAYQTGITSPQQNEVFTYDQMGNWLGYQDQGLSPAQTRSHNRANEITAIANPSGVAQPDYDACGNMTQMPLPADWAKTCTQKWDAWNRLVQVTEIVTGGTESLGVYTYDALTRRIVSLTGDGTRHFYYDQQWRAIEERVGTPTPAIERDYVWGALGRWDLVRRRFDTGSGLAQPLFVLKDYLDPVAIVDNAGAVVERYSYDAFGPTRILDPDFAPRFDNLSNYVWNFLFHAEFRDIETDLYNYGYRYYHPQLGRWLSRDPIGERGGTNLFAMLQNSLTFRKDVYGMAEGGFSVRPYSFPDEGNADDVSGMYEGYEVQYYQNSPCACAAPRNIFLVQALVRTGIWFPFFDVNDDQFAERAKGTQFLPAYPGARSIPGTGGSGKTTWIRDAPLKRGRAGSARGAILKDITWYLEVCAVCGTFIKDYDFIDDAATANLKILGCVRFNFDNESRTIDLHVKGAGYTDPTLTDAADPTGLFARAWINW
jgi:RHS repeat-associated protein